MSRYSWWHGGIRVRHHARQQGSVRLSDGERRSAKLAEFVLTTAFIMRLFIFILLGTLVDFALVGRYWLGGAAVVTVLMLVARPVTVFVCALPDRRARWSS